MRKLLSVIGAIALVGLVCVAAAPASSADDPSPAITARAASSESTRAIRHRNRDRFTSISAVAPRAGTR